MMESIDAQSARLEDMISKYQIACTEAHDSVGAMLTKVDGLLSNGDHCVAKVKQSYARIKTVKASIEEVADRAEKDHETAMRSPKNCEAVPGYEPDPEPTGLRGSYFDNAHFRGPEAAFRDDAEIDFHWRAVSPIAGVPHQKFSVRWDGYIQAPENGFYVFSVEADVGARLIFGDSKILEFGLGGLVMSGVMSASEEAPRAQLRHESKPQNLIGGKKYKIRLEYMHSSHLKWNNPDDAYVKLLWRWGTKADETVPMQSFYRSNPQPPLKVSG
eukprot:GHVU01230749.1.p2 GENE.GHVU01230749.1~~GHVU01230749.1.p2  ORF type:complete len:272 (+),score=46.77 GHVU01230749.1:308-1123(+)